MSKALVMFSLLLVVLKHHDAARIFAWFPTPSISHQVVFRPLTQELAKRGHDVTVVTTDPAFPAGEAPGNLTEINVHNMSYNIWREIFLSQQKDTGNDMYDQMKVLLQAVVATVEAQLKTKDMKRILKGEEKFDLLLLEACSVQTLVMTHVYKVPAIMVSSFANFPGHLKDFGAPFHPFVYPTSLQKRTYNLTMREKMQELYTIWKCGRLESEFAPIVRRITIENFHENFPYLRELKKNVDLLFINEYPFWSGNQPVPPGVVYIGGIHKGPRKELPEDLKTFLDSSKHGVIYISFGTNTLTSLLPSEKIQMLIKVFSGLPYDVLWKWDEDELPGRSQNIRISKWLPQSDLLHHHKVKLFITQGGLQSTDETITAGVPVIGIPLLGDQWFNVERCVRHRVGLQLDMMTLDEAKLKRAIETVIEDPSYRKNVLKLRDIMNDQPMTPLERAVWWTEYVLRHGGAKHLRAPSAYMPWTQYFEVELVLTVIGALIVILLVFAMVVNYLMKILKRNMKYSTKLKDF